jgi:hypothetical protein
LSTKKLNVIWDADALIYGCGFSADAGIIKQEEEALGRRLEPDERKELLASREYVDHALHNAKVLIEKVLSEQFPDREWAKFYLSGPTNFRDAIGTLKVYKGNRDRSHKPKYYKELREYLVTQYEAIVTDGIEADDAVATEQFKYKDKSTVLVGVDKDLEQVPGWHFNPMKGGLYYIDITQANLNFFKQMLIGDTSDNIPGISKIGPKTTEKILDSCGGDIVQFRERVKELYQKEYKEDWAMAYEEVGTLLWLRRKEDQVKCPLL